MSNKPHEHLAPPGPPPHRNPANEDPMFALRPSQPPFGHASIAITQAVHGLEAPLPSGPKKAPIGPENQRRRNDDRNNCREVESKGGSGGGSKRGSTRLFRASAEWLFEHIYVVTVVSHCVFGLLECVFDDPKDVSRLFMVNSLAWRENLQNKL